MRAQRDPQRAEIAHSDRDPKVIDVRRDLVDLRRVSDWFARHADDCTVLRLQWPMLAAGTMSVGHEKEGRLRSVLLAGAFKSAIAFIDVDRLTQR